MVNQEGPIGQDQIKRNQAGEWERERTQRVGADSASREAATLKYAEATWGHREDV